MKNGPAMHSFVRAPGRDASGELDGAGLVRKRAADMAYMLMMVEPVGQRQSRTEAQGREAYARMVRWGESLQERGLLIAAESLRSQSSAIRLQVRAGKPHVIDGPFPETKEIIGGFFLVDCATQQEAIAIASECPAAEWLTVEVRGVAACFEESQAALLA